MAADLAAKEAEYKVLLEEKKQKEKISALEEEHRKELERHKAELEHLQAERDLRPLKPDLKPMTEKLKSSLTPSPSSPFAIPCHSTTFPLVLQYSLTKALHLLSSTSPAWHKLFRTGLLSIDCQCQSPLYLMAIQLTLFSGRPRLWHS